MSEKPTTKVQQQKKTKKATKAPKEKTKKKEEAPKAIKPARVERPKKKQKKAAKQTKPRKAEKAEAEEKKEVVDQPAAVKKEVEPQTPVPVPAVSVRHEDLMKMRKARGFSMPEISSAGLSMLSVKRWGVPFDRRRKSMLPENSEKLKAWLKSPRSANRSGLSRKRKSGIGSRKKK